MDKPVLESLQIEYSLKLIDHHTKKATAALHFHILNKLWHNWETISLLQMFLSTFFPLYEILFIFFFPSGGFIHLTENFRWDLLVALQIKESKRPQEKVKIKLWAGI